MALKYAANNPLRSPDWRWQRGMELYERRDDASAPSRKRDGVSGFAWINKARMYLEAYHADPSELGRARLAERASDIFWAHWIWQSPTNNTRHIMEAYILAGSDDATIADRCGMGADSVRAYEALFFNVREKRTHQSYIVECVLGPTIHHAVSVESLWKLYGYFLGPHMVDVLQSKFVNPSQCTSRDAVSASLMDDAVSSLKLKAAVAAKTLNVSQHTQLAILDIFTKFVEIERTTDSAGRASDQLMDHISHIMGALSFTVGAQPQRPGASQTALDVIDASAVEPTYEETMQLANGHRAPHMQRLVAVGYPQPGQPGVSQ